MVLLKWMIFRLNLFLWLHLISRKFHFQFQSNPDDKYQPAPFPQKIENTSQYFVFLLRRLWGVRERHVLPKREWLLVGKKKSKIMIFFWRGFGRKSLSSGCFTWKRWELYQVNFKLAVQYSLLFLSLQILTIYLVFRS